MRLIAWPISTLDGWCKCYSAPPTPRKHVGLTGHELGLLYPSYEVTLLEKDSPGAPLREGASRPSGRAAEDSANAYGQLPRGSWKPGALPAARCAEVDERQAHLLALGDPERGRAFADRVSLPVFEDARGPVELVCGRLTTDRIRFLLSNTRKRRRLRGVPPVTLDSFFVVRVPTGALGGLHPLGPPMSRSSSRLVRTSPPPVRFFAE
jgi:hypothetical protein